VILVIHVMSPPGCGSLLRAQRDTTPDPATSGAPSRRVAAESITASTWELMTARRLLVGCSRNTVKAALASCGPPKYQRQRSGSMVDGFEPRIRELPSR
jgi:hypothetical protein